MATVEEEFNNIQMSGKRPIPGQSLTNDPESPAPYERAPKYTSVHAASEYLWGTFIEPTTYVNLMRTVAEGVPIMDITQIILFTEFQKGSWNPDLMLMLVEPVAYMIMALAERLDIDIKIYEGELDDENDEEEILGTQFDEDRIRTIIKRGQSGTTPEGILNAQMKESLQSLPEVNLEASKAPEPQENKSLMARPTGV
tara:strand:+ start:427 stop:1020 length:594 start_codon:yes stop_codon:yes gene_type:complete